METQHSPRETYVAEFLSATPIGLDDRGSEKTKRLLLDLAEASGMTSVIKPQTHLSELYGFSGWLPALKKQSAAAIHTYIWDDRQPSFVSIDFASSQPFDVQTKSNIRNVLGNYFSIEKFTEKTSIEFEGWEELAPAIYRQRLSIESLLENDDCLKTPESFFADLCDLLKMVKLGSPHISGENAWQHWETSGVVTSWDQEKFYADIYTCKRFSPEDAIRFFESRIGKVLFSQSF